LLLPGSPLPDEPQGVGEPQRPRRAERPVFPEAVARHGRRAHPEVPLEDPPGGDLEGQGRHLGVFGQIQRLPGPLEAQAPDVRAEHRLRLLEARPGGLELPEQVPAHAHVLRALPGK